MKRIILILILLCHSALVKSQTLAPQVMASGGVYASGGGYSLSQTVGELSVQTATTPLSMLTQGFQQPFSTAIVAVPDLTSTSPFTVYPNPVHNNLFLSFNTETDEMYSVKITDVLGSEVYILQRSLSAIESSCVIDVSGIAIGLYLINIQSTKSQYSKSIRFIKN